MTHHVNVNLISEDIREANLNNLEKYVFEKSNQDQNKSFDPKTYFRNSLK